MIPLQPGGSLWRAESQALESLVRRKERHLSILNAQADRAQAHYYAARAEQNRRAGKETS